MELIDKDKVVAEIKRRMQENLHENPLTASAYIEDEDLLSFLSTLELKEINFEKELDEWLRYGPHTNYPWCTIPDAVKITAEHFFELGLNVKGE